MARSNIANLRSLFMVDRKVFANFSKPPTKDVSLTFGASQVGFKPCEISDLQPYASMSRIALQTHAIQSNVQSSPAEQLPGEVFALWVNHLEDWALSGSQTLQLMFTQRNLPCRVDINRPLVVVNDAPDAFFQVRLGTHRAKAALQVTFRDPSTDRTEQQKISFDPASRGGRLAEGYQHVALPLPKDMKTVEITLAVSYTQYIDDGTDSEPFLFLADVHVGRQNKRTAKTLAPLMALGDAIPTDGFWLSAPMPAIPVPEQSLTVSHGNETETITFQARPNLSVEDYGHTLILHSDANAELTLYVDGAFDRKLSLQQGQMPLRMSERHLDGCTHHLSVRDASGSVPYWESFCLVPAILTPADIMLRESTPPFPDALFAQTPRRYANLKQLFAHAGPKTDFAQLTHAVATVEGGYDNVKLKPLVFPAVSKPDVSIIIPAHNKVEVTYLALCSLLLAHNQASFEVIVVDDASTDETAELETLVSGITVIHNETAQRFIRACNAGAEKARGEYIVLLNNDVEVTAGWIDELIVAFSRFDNVGLAGSKLLYPNGKLQDAGGIIWGSGNPWNYGNQQNPNDPRFCYARQADYLSGAAMMVPAKVWKEVGGLSSYLEPMYFEDTDFSFKVREAGYTTWFVPSSVVYHYEGMTSGTDVSSGFKRYQEVNRPKFKRRWAKDYTTFGREGINPDLEKDRGIVGRVLFIDYTTPRPDQDAGSYAALQEIRLVQSLGYKVTFAATNMAHLGTYTEDLQKLGVEMIYAPFHMTMQEFLNQRATEFDAFYITRYYVAREVLDQLSTCAPEAKILFNNADLHFLREIRAASANGDENQLREARLTREREMEVIGRVDVVLSYNNTEHAVIEAYSEGKARVRRTPWVVDIPEHVPPLAGRSGLSFLGSFRHHPNAEAVLWFVREIIPRLGPLQPDLVLSIYGSRMTDEIKALSSDTVKPVGFVQDVAEAFDPHRIFVAPLLSGAGIKGKVLEALARGIPCVLSPVAAEGIGLRHGLDCLIAQTPEDWAEAITRLYQDDALWQTLSEAARSYMAESYSFESGRIAMREAFEAADLYL